MNAPVGPNQNDPEATTRKFLVARFSTFTVLVVIAVAVVLLILIDRISQRGWNTNAYLDNCYVYSYATRGENLIYVGANCQIPRQDGGYDQVYKLEVLNDGQHKTYELPIGQIYALTIDVQGRVWTGGSAGLAVLNTDGSWTKYTTENSGLVNDMVVALAVDQKDRIWVGTDSGISVLDNNSQWTTYTAGNSGLATDWVSDLVVDADGQLWVSTSEDYLSNLAVWLSVLDADGNWLKYSVDRNSGDIRLEYLDALTIDSRNRVWVGGSGGVSVLEEDGHWKVYTPSNSGLTSGSVRVMASDQQGRVWIGADDGIGILDDNGRWTTYTPPRNSGLHVPVDTLNIDQQGRVWFCCNISIMNPRAALSDRIFPILKTARTIIILVALAVVCLWVVQLSRQYNRKISFRIALLTGALVGPISSLVFSVLLANFFVEYIGLNMSCLPVIIMGGLAGGAIAHRVRSDWWGAVIGGVLGGIASYLLALFVVISLWGT
jgi:ligand-binding sensor domain-containing protein